MHSAHDLDVARNKNEFDTSGLECQMEPVVMERYCKPGMQ